MVLAGAELKTNMSGGALNSWSISDRLKESKSPRDILWPISEEGSSLISSFTPPGRLRISREGLVCDFGR